jgi:hypothetical protein
MGCGMFGEGVYSLYIALLNNLTFHLLYLLDVHIVLMPELQPKGTHIKGLGVLCEVGGPSLLG